MNKIKPTLVILAAGIGSRYGGLKQLDSFSKEGDTILDFSIYDAIKAGFGKVVFIIRENIKEEFQSVFGRKLSGLIQVDYVFQEIDNVPDKYKNIGRIKPWGTAHALLMAKSVVNENFAVINADDFYGAEAFKIMSKSLEKIDKKSFHFNMIGYILKNTISDHGFVSRGECTVNNQGFLTNIIERTHIEKINGELMRKDENDNYIQIDEESIVSMNFFGFTPNFFGFCEKLFDQFLISNHSNPKAEFFIPLVVDYIINKGDSRLKVLMSNSQWFGVTYKEDKKFVQRAIEKLKQKNVYPKKLW
jgi:dTDP-glucose pyrophosphorylase|tara:strand:+ start:706 stop:1614 length:909 start_codon:yes stop_codon:yes gene_type:complete